MWKLRSKYVVHNTGIKRVLVASPFLYPQSYIIMYMGFVALLTMSRAIFPTKYVSKSIKSRAVSSGLVN
jgi:hypothetical protein